MWAVSDRKFDFRECWPAAEGRGGGAAAREEELLAAERLELAQEFLRVKLEAGPRGTIAMIREAREMGITQRTLERARHALGVECHFDQQGKRWMMRLRDAG